MDSTNLIGLRGQVTDIDILSGIGGDCQRCPVALAVGRMLPDYEIWIDEVELNVHICGASQFRVLVSDALFDWIETFDNENRVSPINLVIRDCEEKNYTLELAIA